MLRSDEHEVRPSRATALETVGLVAASLMSAAWTLNDERRMNELVARGIDGLITERLDVMQLLGEGSERKS